MSTFLPLALWLGSASFAGATPVATPLPVAVEGGLVLAAEAELARIPDLVLPNQEPPYLVAYELLDGNVATAASSFGAVTAYDVGPYRSARVEVRVGDYAFDNANFDVSFGERDGVRVRGLPHEDVPIALQRELWLATDEAYKGAAEQLSARRAAREGREPSELPSLVPMTPLVTEPLPVPPVDGVDLRERVVALTAAMADEAWLEEADALGREWTGTRTMVSSEGARGWIPTGFAVIRVEAVTRAPDGARLRDARWWVARTRDQLPPIDQMVGEVDEMVAWLKVARDAPVQREYLGPVLLEAPAAVEFFRQLALPEMSGTPPAEQPPDPYSPGAETGPPTARIGRRLLPEGWSIIDDPARFPDRAGFYTHDFEGVAAQPVHVVQDGVVRDLLMSRVPREGLDGSTGHGRALGADRRVALPAVVTVTAPRARSARTLRRRALKYARQAGLEYVLVVRRLAPPAMSEDFEIAFSGEGPLAGLTRPLEAYRLYPDGREEPVRGLSFVGVDRRALRDVAWAGATGDAVGVMDAASGSRRFSIGSVGGLPASWSAPSVVLSELELRGSGGADRRVLAAPPLSTSTLVAVPPESPSMLVAVPPESPSMLVAVPPESPSTLVALPPESASTPVE
jgi:TldD protein